MMYFWSLMIFCIKWFCPKMSFSALKMHFFDKKCNIYPCSPSFNFNVKELFFRMIFFYLNPKGYVGARWRSWRKPHLLFSILPKNQMFKMVKTRLALFVFKCVILTFIFISEAGKSARVARTTMLFENTGSGQHNTGVFVHCLF